MKTYKSCQSCGIPMSKSPGGGGLEYDGTNSPRFCSYCYFDGKFKMPNITLEEMKTLCFSKLKEMGMPGFIASWLTRSIPKLERWQLPIA